jgi:hypothetical protein
MSQERTTKNGKWRNEVREPKNGIGRKREHIRI